MSESRKKDGRAGRKRLVDREKRRRVKGEAGLGRNEQVQFSRRPAMIRLAYSSLCACMYARK